MTGPHDPQDDLVNILLGKLSRQDSNDRLRRLLLARTTGVVRFRRRLKRFAWATALAACYLAGMATTQMWRPQGGQSSLTAGEHASAAGPRPPSDAGKSLPPQASHPAPRQVASRAPSRFEVLRQSGDAHLRDPAGLIGATHDYTLALNAASAAERAIAPGRDSWLLMALKDAKLKETAHASRPPE